MSRPALLRSMGLTDATLLVVGCIVGVGIFRTASSIAAHVHAPLLILALWIAGGVVSLCGALCYAELAALFPASGGDYVYISKIYGRFWGFLFGWTKLFIERTGTIAILGFVFAEYAHRLIPYEPWMLRWLAALAILALTAVNVAGVRWGTVVQNVFTTLKIIALAALVLAGLSIAFAGSGAHPAWTLPPLTAPPTGGPLGGVGVAFVFVLWTYGGWTEAAYVAEEVKDPVRSIPRAILFGLAATTVLYLLVNWSYLLCVPVDALPRTPLVASRVMEQAFGSGGALFIAAMIACSAFGALNGYILTGGRILYAMGQDHPAFTRMGAVHPRFHTPALALGVNAAIAIALIFTKTFEQIMTYSTMVITVFFTMAVFGVIVLRRREPYLRRPYKAWGYPWTVILYGLTMIGFMIDVCCKEPVEAVFGFGLLLAGLPVYWLSRASSRT